MKLCMCW